MEWRAIMDKENNENNNLELFIKEAKTLLEALLEYDKVTDGLTSIDLEKDLDDEELELIIDDVGGIIADREEINERVCFARKSMIEAMTELSKSEAEADKDNVKLLKKAFEGRCAAGFPAGEVVSSLLSVQQTIMEKDTAFSERFNKKHEEVRVKLKTLQGDKKKIDFLNVNAGPQESVSFDV
jgi:hypothetical protein